MEKFWQKVPLNEMSKDQWESLCDGCAKCCLLKLQDEDDGEDNSDDSQEVYYTNVACTLLDQKSCRCTDYTRRFERVAECLHLTAENLGEMYWLPTTCAYRLVYEGRELPAWHPLVSGDPLSVYTAGMSVKGKTVSQDGVHEDVLEDHIVFWVNDP